MAKPIKFVAAGDVHGDESDPQALKCLFNFINLTAFRVFLYKYH